jgi:predicted Zn finger-like uncharacterized protein
MAAVIGRTFFASLRWVLACGGNVRQNPGMRRLSGPACLPPRGGKPINSRFSAFLPLFSRQAMILSCSACSTRYLIDPVLLGPEGRVVRCAKCGHQWTQLPPEDLPRQVELPPLESEFKAIPGIARPGTNLPALATKRRPRTGLIAWILLLLFVGTLALFGYFARNTIIETWPPAAKLYELMGLPTEAVGAGLELRNVSSARRNEDGTAVLGIEGEVTNVSSAVREVPTMRAILKEGDNEVQNWTFKAAQSRLLPGESASFVTNVRNPSPQATGLTITFTAEK